MDKNIKVIENTKEKGESRSKILKDVERVKRNIDILKSEKKTMLKEQEKTNAFIEKVRVKVIRTLSLEIQKLGPFIQYCLMPRIRVSAKDALYCSVFLQKLCKLRKITFTHQIKLNFSIFSTLIPSLQCSSENEAYNLGVFFKEMLELTKNWNSESKLTNVNQEEKFQKK